jgi:hypothetical protein
MAVQTNGQISTLGLYFQKVLEQQVFVAVLQVFEHALVADGKLLDELKACMLLVDIGQSLIDVGKYCLIDLRYLHEWVILKKQLL